MVCPLQKGFDPYTRIDELLVQNIEVNKKILAVFEGTAQQEKALQLGQITPFDTQSFNLTSAITSRQVRFAPCRYIQATVDGNSLAGITIRMARPDAVAIPLSDVDIIPAGSINELYLDSDVRTGRSRLKLWFVRTEPLRFHLGGDISLAEQAARLGSIYTFDRRGEIIFADDFENGINRWVLTDGAISLTTAIARSGIYCAKLDTVTAVANDGVGILTRLAYPSLTSYGLEIHFIMPTVSQVDLYLDKFDGTNLKRAVLRLNANTSTLQVWTAAGAFSNVATGLSIYTGNTPTNNVFHVLKVVVNYSTDKYSRAIFDNNEYDISANSIVQTANATANHLVTQFIMTTLENSRKYCYLDDVIVTMNEP